MNIPRAEARFWELDFASQAQIDCRREIDRAVHSMYTELTEVRESLQRLDTALAVFEAQCREDCSKSLRRLEAIKNVSNSITAIGSSDTEGTKVPSGTYVDATYVPAPPQNQLAIEADGFCLLSDKERLSTLTFHCYYARVPTYSQLGRLVYLGRICLGVHPEIPRPGPSTLARHYEQLWKVMSSNIQAATLHLESFRELGENEMARLRGQRAGISEDDPDLISHRSSDAAGKGEIVRKLVRAVDGGSEQEASLYPNVPPGIPHRAFDSTLNVESYRRLISLSVFDLCKELEGTIKDIIDAIDVVIPRAVTPSDILPREESGDEDSNSGDSDEPDDSDDSDYEEYSDDEQGSDELGSDDGEDSEDGEDSNA
jgi:hypothetical protein